MTHYLGHFPFILASLFTFLRRWIPTDFFPGMIYIYIYIYIYIFFFISEYTIIFWMETRLPSTSPSPQKGQAGPRGEERL